MIALTESGLDPGLDHLLAQELVARAQRSTGAALAEDAAGDAANGKRIYAKRAASLAHGRAARAALTTIRRQRSRAPLELSVEAFQAFPHEPPNDMPAFSTTVVSDKEAAKTATPANLSALDWHHQR
jgi:hypothetical protein